jgi:hypothetical protein
MRWFVVREAPPVTVRSLPMSMMSAAQPPGPGFPVQAPSV